jgi:hypothetical protein
MEARFVEVGKRDADELRKLNPDVQFPSDLDDWMADFAWNWFIADCSDDYSRTCAEQRGLRNYIHQKFGEINYPYRLK